MKLKDILNSVTVAELHADLSTECSSLCYDSRKASTGSVFFAICGFETDGHLYIPSAIERGAAVIVCERKPELDVPYVLVSDCRYALAIASCNYFGNPSDQMIVIGLTGTNGKTTSSYLIKHILEKVCGDKVGLIGTNGNMIGDTVLHSDRTTPESYELQKLFREMLDAGCKYVVMEVSSHSLKLSRVAGIHFASSTFTNLTQDHLDFHKTMDDYAASKRSLFSVSDAACVNLDDEWSRYMLKGCPVKTLTYSLDCESADLYAGSVKCTSKGVSFRLHYLNREYDASLQIPGLFSVHNALGVIGVCLNLGLDISFVLKALSEAHGVKGRVEVVNTNTDYSVIIDYAHTPDALENVLKTLKPLTEGKLYCVFGCGGDRDRLKRPIMGKIVCAYADVAVVTSDNPRTEIPEDIIADIVSGINDYCNYTVICDRIDAIHWCIDNARSGDVLLLAGKGHEDYQEIMHVKHHMDEREIVLNYLEERKQ